MDFRACSRGRVFMARFDAGRISSLPLSDLPGKIGFRPGIFR